jgi:hypothetical protein
MKKKQCNFFASYGDGTYNNVKLLHQLNFSNSIIQTPLKYICIIPSVPQVKDQNMKMMSVHNQTCKTQMSTKIETLLCQNEF